MILRIPLQIWQQMQTYVRASLPNEVTSIGAIQIVSPEVAEVTEIFLPHQSVTNASSEFNKGELGKIISNFVRNNPVRTGLFLILLEIIQYVLEIYASAGTLMLTVAFSGRASTRAILPSGRETMSLTW